MAVGLSMLNTEKDAKAKEATSEKIEEAASSLRKKAENEAEACSKRNEFLPGFEGELKKNDVDGIFSMLNAWMRQYIRFFFQKKVVNLSKTKKAELKAILPPLLEIYHATAKAANDLVADLSAGATALSQLGTEGKTEETMASYFFSNI